MKKEYNSILEIGNGIIMNKADKAVKDVQDSFNDEERDPKGKGKVVIELTFQQDESGIVYIDHNIKKTLCPTQKGKTMMASGTIINPITGEPSAVLREINGQARGQINVFGEINEPTEVIVGIGKITKEEIKNVETNNEEEH